LKVEEIGIRESNQFPEIVCDYLEGNPFLSDFYAHPPVIDSYADAIKIKSNFSAEKRKILTEELLKTYDQYGVELEDTSAVKQNITRLNNSNTFTITTGHQLCLLGGPMYVHFKIQSVLKLAAQLKQSYPDSHFVPVFWMASEDHDFAEVNHVKLFGKAFTWDKNSRQQPVGRLDLDGIEKVFDQMLSMVRDDEQQRILDACFESYLNSKTLAQATLKYIHNYYKQSGLVIIEPDNKVLKKEFETTIIKDITKRQNFEHLKQTNLRFKPNYKPQVNGREINFFHISEKGRNLIKHENGEYVIGDRVKVYSEDEILQEIAEHPERFSPNVVMRPLFQESILPNLAYVGGPGEISYWLQLKSIFEYNQIPLPILHLRESFIIAGKGLAGKLSKLGLMVKDFLQPENQLIEHFINVRNSDNAAESISGGILQLTQDLIDKVKSIDAGLGSDLIKWKSEQDKYLTHLIKRVNQLRKDSLSSETEKLLKIRQYLLPEGALAERSESFLVLQLQSPHLVNYLMELPFTEKPFIRNILEA
jgi:bacillithiol biosynthesis cysteine-adding enzyme BshC